MAVEKIATICISSSFILLLALQLDSVGFTLASAQPGGSDPNSLNLNGIWERIDGDPYEDMIYVNQKGTEITATFEPMGYCYEDPFNRTEDTSFPAGKLVFRGNLVNNAIHGEHFNCNLEKRTTEFLDLNLRVGTDGTGLIGLGGYYTSADGQRYNINYIIVPGNTDGPVIQPAAVIAIGATIAVGGSGSGFLLYKKGYFKGIKHGIKNTHEEVVEHPDNGKDNLSIIELRIECGLENPEVIKRESSKGDNMITGELTEVEQKFSQVVNNILEYRNKINYIEKYIEKKIEFIRWCEEAKEDPNKILSKISEKVIGEFLSSIQPYFRDLMLSQISVESNISITEDKPKSIKKNITFSLNPIYAYIELVIYSNEVRISSTKFIFAINSYVKIKNLTVYLVKPDIYHHGQQEKQDYQLVDGSKNGTNNDSVGSSRTRRRIEIENLVFGISVELSKMKIGQVEKTIEPPLGIGSKEAEVKNILF